MRGATSSGAVDALYQLGFGGCFDEVWGNSAGALNAAYFVSGQITLGTTIYYENATDPAFINLRNWPDPLDVDWLMRNWIAAGKPLDIGALMKSPTDLYIATSNATTGSAHFFSNRDGRPELMLPALQASCSVPLFVTKKVLIDSCRLQRRFGRSGDPSRDRRSTMYACCGRLDPRNRLPQAPQPTPCRAGEPHIAWLLPRIPDPLSPPLDILQRSARRTLRWRASS